jgi:hypothetical protein
VYQYSKDSKHCYILNFKDLKLQLIRCDVFIAQTKSMFHVRKRDQNSMSTLIINGVSVDLISYICEKG